MSVANTESVVQWEAFMTDPRIIETFTGNRMMRVHMSLAVRWWTHFILFRYGQIHHLQSRKITSWAKCWLAEVLNLSYSDWDEIISIKLALTTTSLEWHGNIRWCKLFFFSREDRVPASGFEWTRDLIHLHALLCHADMKRVHGEFNTHVNKGL